MIFLEYFIYTSGVTSPDGSVPVELTYEIAKKR